MSALQKIDHSAMIVSQMTIVLLNIIAFVLDMRWLVALVAAVMLLGTLLGKPGFGFLYHLLLRPLGLVRPHILDDHPQPHRFAQGVGGTFMLFATLALFLGSPVLGWGLTWLVAILAALNAFGGFCLGCFLYYWLARLRVPGFTQTPPPGTLPGMRPRG